MMIQQALASDNKK